MLDLFEGPHAKTDPQKDALYGQGAIDRTWNVLAPGGVFGVWAEAPDAGFEKRLRQRGFFPSVVALQLTSAPAGPGRRRWSCCAVDEPHVPNATHRERVAMRRLRAAILSVGAVLLFFLCFG